MISIREYLLEKQEIEKTPFGSVHYTHYIGNRLIKVSFIHIPFSRTGGKAVPGRQVKSIRASNLEKNKSSSSITKRKNINNNC